MNASINCEHTLMLPADISLQAPPNLAEAFEDYLDAGINDWGGISPVTADHINPERAWPAIRDVARRSQGRGLALAERLTVYPRYLREPEFIGGAPAWALRRQARADGLALHQYEATPVAASVECPA